MRKIRKPLQLETLEPITRGELDDVFLCCGSPEKRCKGIIRKLAPDYRTQIVLFLKYTNHKSKKREKNVKEMRQVLEKVGEMKEINIDEDKPIPIINEIVRKIEAHAADPQQPKINIDISTIMKWHLLILLKALDLKNLSAGIRFLYTEPEDYVTDLFQPLSFGIRKIFPIPTYSGNFDFSRDSLLVLMLGYEGDRALALLEEMDPTDCLLLIAKPAYHSEWEGRTEEMNKGIINIVGKSKIKYIDSRNPVLVSQQLHTILSSLEYVNYNHVISPLGTKPQALGLYLYLSRNITNTVLIYGSPLRHNELFYSKGIGRSWILPFYKISEVEENKS